MIISYFGTFDKKFLYKSAVPFGVTLICYLFEKILELLTSLVEKSPQSFPLISTEEEYMKNIQFKGQIHDSFAINTLKEIRKGAMGVYSNYLKFMIFMMLLDFAINLFKLCKKYFPIIKNKKGTMITEGMPKFCQSNSFCSILERKEISAREFKGIGIFLFVTVISYSLSYCFCNILEFCTGFTYTTLFQAFVLSKIDVPFIPKENNFSDQVFRKTFDRKLDDVFITQYENYQNLTAAERILTSSSSSFIEILSSISIHAFSSAISPDGQTAFVSSVKGQSLQIINISNPASPSIIASMNFPGRGSPGFAILSPDGQTLFLPGELALYILNVSDITAPILVNSLNYDFDISLPRVAISPNGNILFVAAGITIGFLQIIDVSNPTSPITLSSLNFSQPFVSINISPNGLTLYLVNVNSFQVIDVSNFTSPNNISSLAVNGGSASILSFDGKTAYIRTSQTLEIIDISNSNAPFVSNSVNLPFGEDSLEACTMAVSPDGVNLFLSGISLVVVNLKSLTFQISSVIPYSETINLSPNGKIAYLTTLSQFAVVQVYLNIEISPVYNPNIQNNILSQLYFNRFEPNSIVTSSDGNTVFIASFAELAVVNVSNKSSPALLSIFGINNTYFNSLTLSPDDQTVFLITNSDIVIINVSNLTAPTYFGFFPVSSECNYTSFSISPDANSAFITENCPSLSQLLIFNISDISSPKTITSFQFPIPVGETIDTGVLSSDGETFIALQYSSQIFFIISVSEILIPVQLASVYIDAFYLEFAVSNDGQTLFIPADSIGNFKIIDISNPQVPEIIGSIMFPTSFLLPSIIISPDGNTAYATNGPSLLFIDISNPASPIIFNMITTEYSYCVAISPDGSAVFVGETISLMTVSLANPQYTLYTWNQNFELGKSYSNSFKVLQLNDLNKYDAFNQSYKILSLSQSTVVSNEPFSNISYNPLPTWISFDSSIGIATFTPGTPSEISSYNLYGIMSTSLPTNAFQGIGSINSTTDSLNLMAYLVSLGYLDNGGFLTSSFNPNVTLLLGSQYSANETAIRNVLSQYYFEVATKITVSSSLLLEITDYLSITTPSQTSLNVEIILSANQTSALCQFVNIEYDAIASFTKNQTVISMEGSLVETNAALQQLVVNLGNNVTSCNGVILISDGLNPLLNQTIYNISNYFKINQPPIFLTSAASLQAQIDSTPVYTGQTFIFQIDTNAFQDLNNADLTYSLAMQDSTEVLPDWLSVRNFDIVGIPPEKLSSLKINFLLVVSNQYKSIKVPFTLSIRISTMYFLKLFLSIASTLITIIGLWTHAYKAYNVLGKKYYKYPKDFIVRVGEEITNEKIYPIPLISEEVNACKFVLMEMHKNIAKEFHKSSIKQNYLVEYFLDSSKQKIDKDKLIHKIDETITFSKDKLEDQSPGFNPEYKLVRQLVYNEIINRQLNLKKEKLTKRAFEKIKNNWIKIVEKNHSLSHPFSINPDKLVKELISLGINLNRTIKKKKPSKNPKIVINGASPNSSMISFMNDAIVSTKRNESMEADLMDFTSNNMETSDINLDLLESAILAHAFKSQNINNSPVNIDIMAGLKQSGTSIFHKIKQFFKLDIKPITLSSKTNRIGYGLKYKIQKDVIYFCGTLCEKAKGKTLVIQIKTSKGRILRELWINVVEKSLEESRLIRERTSAVGTNLELVTR